METSASFEARSAPSSYSTFRPLRQDWVMEFASSGREALAKLEESEFDVLVTDMQMPGMNGADLSNEIKNRYPRTVRMILSGQGDSDAILQSLGSIHRFLSKPCDAEKLKEHLTSALAVRDLLEEEKLKAFICRLESIPSLPELYFEVMNQLQSQEPSITKLAQTISKDLGMTAKVLQLVNSAPFGSSRQISDVEHAIRLFGIDAIRSLLMSVCVFTELTPEQLEALDADALWRHSLTTAAFAQAIARCEKTDQKIVEEAFVGREYRGDDASDPSSHCPWSRSIRRSIPKAYQWKGGTVPLFPDSTFTDNSRHFVPHRKPMSVKGLSDPTGDWPVPCTS
jgi:CheY-like chemotaxis protein